jgi:hypothetical protein
MFPPAPPLLQRRNLSVSYVSAAARAQEGTKAISMGKFAQELLPMAQIDPGILDIIDTDKFASRLAMIRGVSRTVLRSPEDMAKMREERMKQQQMQQLAQVAGPASQAVKNLSEANKTGNIF